jgi:hypothetical protein
LTIAMGHPLPLKSDEAYRPARELAAALSSGLDGPLTNADADALLDDPETGLSR